MANTTPIANAQNIDLANSLNDIPVAGGDDGVTASTSGTVFSASQRNLALSDAYNQLAVRLVGKYGKDAGMICEGIVTTQTVTFASAGTTINLDYVSPITLLKSDNAEFALFPLNDLKQDRDPYLDAGYALEGGKLYAYQRSSGTLSQLTSGTGTFYYIKADRRSTTTGAPIAVNTAPDTTIDQTWLNWCIDWAALWLCRRKGAGRWKERIPEYTQLVEDKLPKV